jgi:serine protease inhibitor
MNVDEKNTEAVSQTSTVPSRGLASVRNQAPSPAALFNADHPFLFMIRHRATNSILFAGHMTKATVAQNSD